MATTEARDIRRIVTTTVNSATLPMVLTLADRVRAVDPQVHFIAHATDVHAQAVLYESGVEFIPLDVLEHPEAGHVESAGASSDHAVLMRPVLLADLLDRIALPVVYLDPDVDVLGP